METTIHPQTAPHPTLTMSELQTQILRNGWTFTKANEQHLPRLAVDDARALTDRNWRVGDILLGDVNNSDEHWHYLLF